MEPLPADDFLRSPPTEIVHATVVDEPRRQRRWRLPLGLFVATCFSTLWAGAAGTQAVALFVPPAWPHLRLDWGDGLIYMVAVMAILLAHEMGHFVLTLRHRIPASLPFFIPMPISPIGTMGAVIGMQAFRADRRQLFDIGIAGPLAGLVVALPILFVGIQRAEQSPPLSSLVAAATPDDGVAPGATRTVQVTEFHDPLLVKLLVRWLRPDIDPNRIDANPLWMAGWVGLLITGLNMLPISQLDGGHISYALFGKRAHLIARMFVLVAVVYMVATNTYMWVVMLALLMFLGVDHPPTANDGASLGWGRRLLGLASLAIPVLCFPPQGISAYEVEVPVRLVTFVTSLF